MRLNKVVALPTWTFWCMALYWPTSSTVSSEKTRLLIEHFLSNCVDLTTHSFTSSFCFEGCSYTQLHYAPNIEYKWDQTVNHTLCKFSSTYQKGTLRKWIISECRCVVTCKSWSDTVSPKDNHECKKVYQCKVILYSSLPNTKDHKTRNN